MLTTQEAADLLNISRPTLVRLLESGDMPFSMRGKHRRVLLRDVLNYQERSRRERHAGLDAMVAEGEEAGLIDAEVSGYHHLIDAMPNDPKDRHVSAAAVWAAPR